MALLFQLSHLEVVPTEAFPEDALSQELFPMALLPKKLADSGQKLAVAGDSTLVRSVPTLFTGRTNGASHRAPVGYWLVRGLWRCAGVAIRRCHG